MYFPMVMELKGKKCLIAGGGKVAYHKALILYHFEADLKVVSPSFCTEFSNGELPFDKDLLLDSTQEKSLIFSSAEISENSSVEYIKRHVQKSDIISSDIVIASTGDRTIDTEISNIAKENKIPVNVVDVPQLCTFLFPAMISEGPLNIAVSTSGKSPVASARIRDSIKETLPDFMTDLVQRMGEIRPLVLKENLTHEEKKNIFSELYTYGMEHKGKIPRTKVLEILKQK